MSASKQIGTRYESLVRDYFTLWQPDTERRTLSGSKDRGDLNVPGEKRFIFELKAHKRFELAKWVEEAKVEADNAGLPYGVVIHKRRMAAVGESFVTMPLYAFMGLLYGEPIEPEAREKRA